MGVIAPEGCDSSGGLIDKTYSANRPAIVLAAYGSLRPAALAAYDLLKVAYEREFPGSAVKLAFTSRAMRRNLREKGIPSPLAALAELQDQGQKDVVVQPLQIVPGQEFHHLVSLVQGLERVKGKFGFRSLELGAPLLADLDDCRRASRALQGILFDLQAAVQTKPLNAEITLNADEAVLWMGHGTGHPADSLYALVAQLLQKDHARLFLGTLEGFPGLDDLIGPMKRCEAKRITLLPFLLVSGGHAEDDMAGSDPGSWKSILEAAGFEVAAYPCGILESGEIAAMFMEHTCDALKRIEGRA